MEEAYGFSKYKYSSYLQWPCHIRVSFNLYDNHLTIGLLTTFYTGEDRDSFKVASQVYPTCEYSLPILTSIQTGLRASQSQSVPKGRMSWEAKIQNRLILICQWVSIPVLSFRALLSFLTWASNKLLQPYVFFSLVPTISEKRTKAFAVVFGLLQCVSHWGHCCITWPT